MLMLCIVKRVSTWAAYVGWHFACVCRFCIILLIVILFVFVWSVSGNEYLYAYKVSISSRYIHMQKLSVILSLSEKLGEGVGGWSKWKLRIENCVFATANSQFWNLSYGF